MTKSPSKSTHSKLSLNRSQKLQAAFCFSVRERKQEGRGSPCSSAPGHSDFCTTLYVSAADYKCKVHDLEVRKMSILQI